MTNGREARQHAPPAALPVDVLDDLLGQFDLLGDPVQSSMSVLERRLPPWARGARGCGHRAVADPAADAVYHGPIVGPSRGEHLASDAAGVDESIPSAASFFAVFDPIPHSAVVGRRRSPRTSSPAVARMSRGYRSRSRLSAPSCRRSDRAVQQTLQPPAPECAHKPAWRSGWADRGPLRLGREVPCPASTTVLPAAVRGATPGRPRLVRPVRPLASWWTRPGRGRRRGAPRPSRAPPRRPTAAPLERAAERGHHGRRCFVDPPPVHRKNTASGASAASLAHPRPDAVLPGLVRRRRHHPALVGSPSPPTITGRPAALGRRSTSTAAMNWSRSTCRTQCSIGYTPS